MPPVSVRHVALSIVCRKMESTHIEHIKGKWVTMEQGLPGDHQVSGALLNFLSAFWKKNSPDELEVVAVEVSAFLI